MKLFPTTFEALENICIFQWANARKLPYYEQEFQVQGEIFKCFEKFMSRCLIELNTNCKQIEFLHQ